MAKLERPCDLKPHPRLGGTELLPALTEDEYRALLDSIGADGILQPLLVAYPEMVVLDGHHRLRAALELGLDEVPVITEETRSEAARVRLGIDLNLARRHLSSEQKRAAAAALLKADPKQSDRSVAAAVGLSHPTVASVRSGLEQSGDVEESSTRTDSLGREQPARKPKPTNQRPKPKGASVISLDERRLRDPESAVEAPAADPPATGDPPPGAFDLKDEIRKAKREVATSPWGRLTTYIVDRLDVPPRLTREQVREAVSDDFSDGFVRTARAIRDFLSLVIEEAEAAKEVTNAASR